MVVNEGKQDRACWGKAETENFGYVYCLIEYTGARSCHTMRQFFFKQVSHNLNAKQIDAATILSFLPQPLPSGLVRATYLFHHHASDASSTRAWRVATVSDAAGFAGGSGASGNSRGG